MEGLLIRIEMMELQGSGTAIVPAQHASAAGPFDKPALDPTPLLRNPLSTASHAAIRAACPGDMIGETMVLAVQFDRSDTICRRPATSSTVGGLTTGEPVAFEVSAHKRGGAIHLLSHFRDRQACVGEPRKVASLKDRLRSEPH